MGEALLSLIFGPHEREAIGKECRKMIEERYELNVQARAYLELYEELVGACGDNMQVPPAATDEDLWETGREAERKETSPVRLETGIGPHFSEIYDKVAFRALKDFAFHVFKQWQASEKDRKIRLGQTKELKELFEESEADRKARFIQVKELKELLEESEADRKARLDHINELNDLLEESEADRKARLDHINELNDHINELSVRAEAAEEGWRNLEATFAVRQARRLGIVKVEQLELNGNAKSEEIEMRDK